MKRMISCALAVCVLVIGASAMLAAPARNQTPGTLNQAKVWIGNRGRLEAVPVRIEDAAAEPLRVAVAGTPSVQVPGDVTISSKSIVRVQAARQNWDYRLVYVQPGQDPPTSLSQAGSEGWEAIGLALPTPGGSAVVVMKRPKQN